MDPVIMASVVAGLFSVVGIFISHAITANRMTNEIKQQSLLGDAKLEAQITQMQLTTHQTLEELTREVRRHNNFAERTPLLEEKVQNIEHRLGTDDFAGTVGQLNMRMQNLEQHLAFMEERFDWLKYHELNEQQTNT